MVKDIFWVLLIGFLISRGGGGGEKKIRTYKEGVGRGGGSVVKRTIAYMGKGGIQFSTFSCVCTM